MNLAVITGWLGVSAYRSLLTSSLCFQKFTTYYTPIKLPVLPPFPRYTRQLSSYLLTVLINLGKNCLAKRRNDFKADVEAASSGWSITIRRSDTPDGEGKTEQRTYILHDCNSRNTTADETNVLPFENNRFTSAWVCLHGRTRISSQVLDPLTHPLQML